MNGNSIEARVDAVRLSSNSLLKHKFKESERLWLEFAANAEPFDPRIARAKLHTKLPKDFDPSRIDTRFYRNDRLTVLGLRFFKPEAPVLAAAERVAIAVRDEILRDPGINEITLDDIARLAKLTKFEAHGAIDVLEDVLTFFNGVSEGSPSGRPRTYYLAGPHGYDAPLAFTTLDDAMKKSYEMQSLFPNFNTPAQSPQSTPPKGRKPTVKVEKQVASSTKRNTAFVIMAIDPKRPELTDVLDAIKSVCLSFGIKAHRADEIEHQDRITKVVLEEILSCEFLIADLTHERPNVYYEVGFAHAIDKKPILFRRAGTPLHFDLSVHNVPEYRNIKELRELIQRRFEAILGRNAN